MPTRTKSTTEHTVPIAGRELARIRNEAGISQHRLGVRADVTGATIAQLEGGHRLSARLSTAKALAAALEVELGAILVPWEEL